MKTTAIAAALVVGSASAFAPQGAFVRCKFHENGGKNAMIFGGLFVTVEKALTAATNTQYNKRTMFIDAYDTDSM